MWRRAHWCSAHLCRTEPFCRKADQPRINLQRPNRSKRYNSACATELDAGGLGIGMGIQYTPGATRLEVIDMFRLAAESKLPVYTHMRSAGRIEPGSAIEASERSDRRGSDHRRVTAHRSHQQHLPARFAGMSLHDRRSARPRPRCDHGSVSLHRRHDGHQLGGIQSRAGGRNLASTIAISFCPIPASTSPKSVSTNCIIPARRTGC